VLVAVVGGGILLSTLASDVFRWDPIGVETRCGEWPFTCAIGTGLGVTAFAVAAGFAFWSLLRKQRLVALYRTRVRRLPGLRQRAAARISPQGRRDARQAGIVPRADLYALIVEDLRRGSPRPQLIVGAIGTGKSFAMNGLVRELAAKHFVPVQVDISRAKPGLDLLGLARDRFKRAMERDLLRSDEDFGVWQQIQRERRLVVLVDGLGGPGRRTPERDDIVRDALQRAAEDDYGLVVAARPEDVPEGLNVAVFELGPLDVGEAADFVVNQARSRAERRRAVDGRETVNAFLAAAEITETPFYLDYIAELHAAGRLAEMSVDRRPRFGLRLDLLEEYVMALMSAHARPEARLLGTSRTEVVDALAVAAHTNLSDAGDGPVSVPDHRPEDAFRAAEDAKRLELADTVDGQIRFRHAILEGYLAALQVVDGDAPVEECRRLLSTTRDEPGARTGVAVAIAGGLLAAGTPDAAAAVARAIVATAGERSDGTSFPLITGAIDIATLLDGAHADRVLSDIADFARDRIDDPQPKDPAVERIRVAARLRRIGGTQACRALWHLTADSEYLVRLAAARRLAELGDVACGFLERELSAMPAATGRVDEQQLQRWGVEAWLLPSLHATGDASREWVAERIGAWLAVPWEHAHPALEASLAQGFKFAATRSAERLARPDLEIKWARCLLARARFWYAKVNLLQAVTVWDMRAGPPYDAARAVIRPLVSGGHPFVCRTARLCRDALGGDIVRHVWADEAAVSRRATSGPWPHSPVAEGWRALGDRASMLMGDVILALNLIEGDSRDTGGDRRDRIERACVEKAPVCLGPPADLERLRVGGTQAVVGSTCTARCDQQLCPYPARARPTYRGELTEAFCRHQADIRGRRQSRALWLEMEQRVQA
jgi:hypothetical protein